MLKTKDGWCFERARRDNLDDGSVRIVHETPESRLMGKPLEVVFDADTWASIVASVSYAGETAGRWQRAKMFHNQPEWIERTDG